MLKFFLDLGVLEIFMADFKFSADLSGKWLW